MIEINAKAKKFNPCESVLGLELSLLVLQQAVVGSAYYTGHENEDIPNKDVVFRGNPHWKTRTLTALKAAGFVEVNAPFLDGSIRCFRNGDKKIFMVSSPSTFQKFVRAAEVCKYLYVAGAQVDVNIAANVHDIVMYDAKVTHENGGLVMKLPAVAAHQEWDEDDDNGPVEAPAHVAGAWPAPGAGMMPPGGVWAAHPAPAHPHPGPAAQWNPPPVQGLQAAPNWAAQGAVAGGDINWNFAQDAAPAQLDVWMVAQNGGNNNNGG